MQIFFDLFSINPQGYGYRLKLVKKNSDIFHTAHLEPVKFELHYISLEICEVDYGSIFGWFFVGSKVPTFGVFNFSGQKG